jgi:hypothetical protein
MTQTKTTAELTEVKPTTPLVVVKNGEPTASPALIKYAAEHWKTAE